MDSLRKEIEDCALRNYPFEMVGCVVGGRFIELKNVSNNKKGMYSLSAKDKVMLFELGETLEALVHSHPELDNNPSKADLIAQKSCNFPFLIIGTDGKSCTDIKRVE